MEEQEGKLFCHKCNTKLGAYKWYGDQCSCGYVFRHITTTLCDTDRHSRLPLLFVRAWCTPAIQILHSRVDCVEPSAPLQVRLPPQFISTAQQPQAIEQQQQSNDECSSSDQATSTTEMEHDGIATSS
jgi:hypothetical protein